MDVFFTQDEANEGIRLDLTEPDGTPSKHWLQVLSTDSDKYRRANSKAQRKIPELAIIEDDEQREAAVEEEELTLRCVLVAGWSFPMPCTPKNVRRFLKKAPQIADEVYRQARAGALFYGKKRKASSSTQEQK